MVKGELFFCHSQFTINHSQFIIYFISTSSPHGSQAVYWVLFHLLPVRQVFFIFDSDLFPKSDEFLFYLRFYRRFYRRFSWTLSILFFWEIFNTYALFTAHFAILNISTPEITFEHILCNNCPKIYPSQLSYQWYDNFFIRENRSSLHHSSNLEIKR